MNVINKYYERYPKGNEVNQDSVIELTDLINMWDKK